VKQGIERIDRVDIFEVKAVLTCLEMKCGLRRTDVLVKLKKWKLNF
jgi:hypothetical protein